MKNLFKCLFVLVIGIVLFPSCLDQGYGWDDLDKNGEFNLPMVPLGNFDTIKFEGLPVFPSIPPEFINEQITANFAVIDTIRGLFDEDVSKNFFYEGKTTDVYFNGTFLMIDPPSNTNFNIALAFKVLGENNKPIAVNIPIVKLENVDLTGGFESKLKIVIEKQYMQYMKDARHLTVTVAVKTSISLNDLINSKSAFQLRDMQLYTGSVAFEL